MVISNRSNIKNNGDKDPMMMIIAEYREHSLQARDNAWPRNVGCVLNAHLLLILSTPNLLRKGRYKTGRAAVG